MATESRTIIHFTKSAEPLKGILKIGFKLKYCRERVMFGDTEKQFRVPMVSFCDISISQAAENISKYGQYGVGLTEQWAIKRGLTPVIYLQRYSALAESMLKLSDRIVEDESKSFREWLKQAKDQGKSLAEALMNYVKEEALKAKSDDLLMNAMDILRYTKNYKGDLVRANGERTPDYYFGDEREWRYALKTRNFGMFMYMEQMTEKEGMAEMMQKLIDDQRLLFDAQDISFIIVPTDGERDDIQRHIESLGDRFSQDEMAELKSKVLKLEELIK
ncbi:abortive infection system antitoxin AbiGi family protein [Prosthecobacter sp.]|jgi:hypothetical protein|uniref:abortive infection system antitoxin AbiGi family protein n=1 Tax=Prosthecobacter sp. TaxID=1965333 RepID=UPI0037C7BF70